MYGLVGMIGVLILYVVLVSLRRMGSIRSREIVVFLLGTTLIATAEAVRLTAENDTLKRDLRASAGSLELKAEVARLQTANSDLQAELEDERFWCETRWSLAEAVSKFPEREWFVRSTDETEINDGVCNDVYFLGETRSPYSYVYYYMTSCLTGNPSWCL